jgi:hypothetical protein
VSQPLEPSVSPVTQPTDTSVWVEHHVHGLRVTRRGRWSLATIGWGLFICLFWNGLVGVFVFQLVFLDMHWGMRVYMAVFLIPFEVIGLIFLWSLLVALAGPLARERWTLDRESARRQWSLGPLCWSRQWSMREITGLELTRATVNDIVFTSPIQGSEEISRQGWNLAFVDAQRQEKFRITGLTTGEAKWIADRVMKQFPQQFAAA